MPRSPIATSAGPRPANRRFCCKPALGRRCALIACLLACLDWGAAAAHAQSSARPAADQPAADRQTAPADTPTSKIVAMVNRKEITREELGQDCLRHYGKEVLESLINKHLIVEECQRQGVSVARAEVDAEINRLAKRFGLPVDQWLKMLKQERGIGAAQYASDIIWPTLALRKLAGERLRVTREELIQTFESQYGPAVRARLIACKDRAKAEKIRATAAANPEQFGALAKE